jgi:hypothetical protein
MNILQLLDQLGVLDAVREDLTEEQEEILNADIEVHYQQIHPLKSKVENIRVLDGKVAIALEENNSYGSKRAWKNPAWEDEDE